MKWISVKNRLPEESVSVLGFGFSGSSSDENRSVKCLIVSCHSFYKDEKHWRVECQCYEIGGELGFEVTHWMPLPEAPK
jgi:hypothetical protein